MTVPTPSTLARLRIAALTTLCVAATLIVLSPTLADSPAKIGNVNADRVAADADGANWLLNGRNFESHHFSPLKQVTDQQKRQVDNSEALAWN